MKKKYMYVLVFIGIAIGGCSSVPTKEQIASDNAKAEAIRLKSEDDTRAHEQKKMEGNISQVPDWALKQAKPDSTGVFAVGMGESDVVRVALHKAVLEAEFGLAKNFNQELSGSERVYVQDNNGKVGNDQYTRLIDNLVSHVPVVGFEIINQEVKVVNGKYNAFVLVKLSYDQFNRVLQEQRKNSESKTIEKAFDDLQSRLDKRRRQRIEDASGTSVINSVTANAITKQLNAGDSNTAGPDASVSSVGNVDVKE
jgi:hypothetical protein